MSPMVNASNTGWENRLAAEPTIAGSVKDTISPNGKGMILSVIKKRS
jgi:hypothetical protein